MKKKREEELLNIIFFIYSNIIIIINIKKMIVIIANYQVLIKIAWCEESHFLLTLRRKEGFVLGPNHGSGRSRNIFAQSCRYFLF